MAISKNSNKESNPHLGDKTRAGEHRDWTTATNGKSGPGRGDANGYAERLEAILGSNPFLGFSRFDIFQVGRELTTRLLTQPTLLMKHQAAFGHELFRILSGQSDLAPEAGDKRFEDAAWRENPYYRAGMQTYLAWRQGLNNLVDEAGLNGKSAERARFALSLVTEACAPTNFLAGNPAVIKRAVET